MMVVRMSMKAIIIFTSVIIRRVVVVELRVVVVVAIVVGIGRWQLVGGANTHNVHLNTPCIWCSVSHTRLTFVTVGCATSYQACWHHAIMLEEAPK